MKRPLLRFARRRNRAFSIVELLVCLAVLFVLAGLLLFALAWARPKTSRISCINNLKQVGLGFRIFAGDNADKFPMQVPVADGGILELLPNAPASAIFRAMSNELGATKTLSCSHDLERLWAADFGPSFSNTNISYFIGLDAKTTSPDVVLAGDRNVTNGLATTNHVLAVARDGRIGWTHQLHNNQGNVALADGSVMQFTSGKLHAQFRAATNAVQRLAIPE